MCLFLTKVFVLVHKKPMGSEASSLGEGVFDDVGRNGNLQSEPDFPPDGRKPQMCLSVSENERDLSVFNTI